MAVRQPAQFIHTGVSWQALKGPGLCGLAVVLSFGKRRAAIHHDLQRPRTVRRSRRALRAYLRTVTADATANLEPGILFGPAPVGRSFQILHKADCSQILRIPPCLISGLYIRLYPSVCIRLPRTRGGRRVLFLDGQCHSFRDRRGATSAFLFGTRNSLFRKVMTAECHPARSCSAELILPLVIQPLCAPQISRATIFARWDPSSVLSLLYSPQLPCSALSFAFVRFKPSRHAALYFYHRPLLPLRFLSVFFTLIVA